MILRHNVAANVVSPGRMQSLKHLLLVLNAVQVSTVTSRGRLVKLVRVTCVRRASIARLLALPAAKSAPRGICVLDQA